MKPVLFGGIGNPYRRDDGVGLWLAAELKKRLPEADAMFVGDASSLLGYLKNYEAVFLFDAVSSGSFPGKLHRLDASNSGLPLRSFRHSSHAFGVSETVELSRLLGELPELFRVYGVEGGDFGEGEEFSPEVSDAAWEVVDMVLREIKIFKRRKTWVS